MSNPKNIVTYVVDHGEVSPTVVAGTVINGEKCFGVSFSDLIDENAELEEMIEDINLADDIEEVREILKNYGK